MNPEVLYCTFSMPLIISTFWLASVSAQVFRIRNGDLDENEASGAARWWIKHFGDEP